jgi:hypothetical protein
MNLAHEKNHEDCNRGKQQHALQRVLPQLQRSTAGVLRIAWHVVQGLHPVLHKGELRSWAEAVV